MGSSPAQRSRKSVMQSRSVCDDVSRLMSTKTRIAEFKSSSQLTQQSPLSKRRPIQGRPFLFLLSSQNSWKDHERSIAQQISTSINKLSYLLMLQLWPCCKNGKSLTSSMHLGLASFSSPRRFEIELRDGGHL